MLTDANASLLIEHGTETQKRVFAVPELAFRWTGTMCLSESQAGSSLADITTRAVPDGAGHESDPLGPRYRITGNKMWISAAEHDLTENIIHLVLAKIPREDGTVDPSTKGISLFIVPKVLVDEESRLLERNDVTLVSLNHKLGNRGAPNAALTFGDGTHTPRGSKGAIGYLVGRPGDGLRQMFHMMNAARIEIGLAASALGMAGYATALDYAKDRRQGRPRAATGKDSSQPQVPIVEHADVKRMLLAQKAYAEGGTALGPLRSAAARRPVDRVARRGRASLRAARDPDPDREELAERMVSGGKQPRNPSARWCRVHARLAGGDVLARPATEHDPRRHPRHPGARPARSQGAYGRRVHISARWGSRSAARSTQRSGSACAQKRTRLPVPGTSCWSRTEQAWSTGDPSEALANATPYLQGFGHVVAAWIHLDLAVAATHSDHSEAPGRIAAMKYFFAYELPRIGAWLGVVARREALCRDVNPDSL